MRSEHFEKINEILNKYEADLFALNPKDFSQKSLPNKWSKKEIMGHLIDSAFNNYQRIVRAEEKDDLIFEGYNQDEWVVKNNYQNRDAQEVITLFISANRHIADMIASLNKNILERSVMNHNFDKICMNPVEEGKPTSLVILIEDYIFHLRHHLKQIVE